MYNSEYNSRERKHYYYCCTKLWSVLPAASVKGIQTKISPVRLYTMVEEDRHANGEIPPVGLRNRSHTMNGDIASPGEFVFW